MAGGFRIAPCVVIAAIAFPAVAQAHIERPSYWPDPAPDKSVSPPAGGHVPKIRSLGSALKKKPPGKTLVVCQKHSLKRARNSIDRARKHGFDIRPHDHRKLSKHRAKRLRRINRALAKRCNYREIEPAAKAARNNDRIVIMPGVYTEPTARKQPTHDPKCDKYEVDTEFGDPGALSYAYQYHCPTDQNLIAVLGRKLGKGKDPDPPRYDRHGIPNTGPCIRCNVQMEGSGVSADDVVVDAGNPKQGNKGPAKGVKDVGIRADRADGFVLRNITVRHANEHGIYPIESDGYMLDRFKVFYDGLYGVLAFVEDHGVVQNCEGVGHADSAIYPGAAVETGVQRPLGTHFRYNQQVRRCDLHHNLAGYSGTDGNAVWVHNNNFYDNALGLQTDVVTAAGHPGFPGDSMLVEDNRFYSNNFNPYEEGSDIDPAFPFPAGTGSWIAGGNWHQVRNNHYWNNWRRGTMVFSVPDALVCGPDSNNNAQKGCNPSRASTSHYNRHYDNIMGRAPNGKLEPNGVDFWWDEFAGSRGNCWFRNSGGGSFPTSDPSTLPNCDNGNDPATSVGHGNPKNEGELTGCAVAFETRNFDQPSTCVWLTSPSKPSSSKNSGRLNKAQASQAVQSYERFCADFPESGTCAPSLAGTLRFPRAFAYERPAKRPAGLKKNLNLQLYKCTNWKHAGEGERRYVIYRLREITSGQVSGTGVRGRGAVIPDDKAHRLFDNYCANDFARGFLLYKLHGFASGFVGGTP
jgi:hypothetical protein